MSLSHAYKNCPAKTSSRDNIRSRAHTKTATTGGGGELRRHAPHYPAKSAASYSGRISISESSSIGFGQRFSHATASSIDFTSHSQ